MCSWNNFTYDMGSTSCFDCAQGMYRYLANQSSSSPCLYCPAGKISDRDQSCTPCSNGKYSRLGSTACLTCEFGEEVHEGWDLLILENDWIVGEEDVFKIIEISSNLTWIRAQMMCAERINGPVKPQLAVLKKHSDFKNISSRISNAFIGLFKGNLESSWFWIDQEQLNFESAPFEIFNRSNAFGMLVNGSVLMVDEKYTANSFVCSVPKASLKVCRKCKVNQYPTQPGFCKACPIGKYTNIPGSLLCIDCEAGTWSSELGESCNLKAFVLGDSMKSITTFGYIFIGLYSFMFLFIMNFNRQRISLQGILILLIIDLYLDLIYLLSEPYKFEMFRILHGCLIIGSSLIYVLHHLISSSLKGKSSLNPIYQRVLPDFKNIKFVTSIFEKNDHLHKLLISFVLNTLRAGFLLLYLLSSYILSILIFLPVVCIFLLRKLHIILLSSFLSFSKLTIFKSVHPFQLSLLKIDNLDQKILTEELSKNIVFDLVFKCIPLSALISLNYVFLEKLSPFILAKWIIALVLSFIGILLAMEFVGLVIINFSRNSKQTSTVQTSEIDAVPTNEETIIKALQASDVVIVGKENDLRMNSSPFGIQTADLEIREINSADMYADTEDLKHKLVENVSLWVERDLLSNEEKSHLISALDALNEAELKNVLSTYHTSKLAGFEESVVLEKVRISIESLYQEHLDQLQKQIFAEIEILKNLKYITEDESAKIRRNISEMDHQKLVLSLCFYESAIEMTSDKKDIAAEIKSCFL
jgi:hypothetical protein